MSGGLNGYYYHAIFCFYFVKKNTFSNKIKLVTTIDPIENELFIDDLIKLMKILVYIYSFFIDVFLR